MSRDFPARAHALTEAVLGGPGDLPPAVRRAAAEGASLPEPAAKYAEKVRRFAYKVMDEDIDALRAAGYSDSQIYELTEAAAYGAARVRLDAALAVLDAPEVSEQ
jgi:alkylhydroperoxidase family enzyme